VTASREGSCFAVPDKLIFARLSGRAFHFGWVNGVDFRGSFS
jgi:hypothetical protein